MGQTTKIEWCDHSFNPWWGCQRVSPGCEHCYAESFSNRVGHKIWGPVADRRFFGEKHWAEPLKWNASAERDGIRRRVFCASMGDVFEAREDLLLWRGKLRSLIQATPSLDWLLLTKRPENVRPFWPDDELPENVWIGTTCEDQSRADLRLPILSRIRARVRFASYEPALERVDFSAFAGSLSWIICGAESGHGARPFDLNWARDVRDQCVAAGLPFFFKQDVRGGIKIPTPELDGKRWIQWPT